MVTFLYTAIRDRGSVIEPGHGILDFGDGTVVGDGEEPNDFLVFERRIPLSLDFELVQFSITHTYPASGYYTISLKEDFRSNCMNIPNSVDTPFFVELSFAIDPTVPNIFPHIRPDFVLQAFVGRKLESAIHVMDEDGDLILFRLGIPKQAKESRVHGYRQLNHPDFYSNYTAGNQNQTATPQLLLDMLTGNMIWDAPGDASLAGSNKYAVVIIVSEHREVFGEWTELSRTVIDYNIQVYEEELADPNIAMITSICDEATDYVLDISGDNREFELEVDIPFFNLDDGRSINELTGQVLLGDKTFPLIINPEYELTGPYILGFLQVKFEARLFFYNVFYTEDCLELSELEPLVTGSQEHTDVSIFPNPSQGQVTIHTGKTNLSLIRIVSLSGQLILQKKPDAAWVTLEFIQKKPKQGIYLVQFLDAENRLIGIEKLIIE